ALTVPCSPTRLSANFAAPAPVAPRKATPPNHGTRSRYAVQSVLSPDHPPSGPARMPVQRFLERRFGAAEVFVAEVGDGVEVLHHLVLEHLDELALEFVFALVGDGGELDFGICQRLLIRLGQVTLVELGAEALVELFDQLRQQ